MENNDKTALDQVVSKGGIENILDVLCDHLRWSELQTLLLNVFERRTKKVKPTDVLTSYLENRFVGPSLIDPKEMLEIDRIMYNCILPIFVPIELSPVTAIGANSILASINPKTVLSTIRGVEVISDPTMALAIECAKRRSECPEVNLATSHRSIRAQSFPPGSNLTSHFRAFALASSAMDIGHRIVEFNAMLAHIRSWLNFLSASEGIGYNATEISVAFSDISIMEMLISEYGINRESVTARNKNPGQHVFEDNHIDIPATLQSMQGFSTDKYPISQQLECLRRTEISLVDTLRQEYPSVAFFFDLERCSGVGYYSGLCYKIRAKTQLGQKLSIADGGVSDWMRKLLANKKERIFTSGFGSELFCRMFKKITAHSEP